MNKMPRLKVDPRHRQRVAQACDSCKKRKEKCNGALPCEQCKSRRREDDCRYSRPNRRFLRQNGTNYEQNETNHEQSDGEIRVMLNVQANSVSQTTGILKQSSNDDEISAPIPKNARMLRDGNGKFIYVGESASVSLLQTVRGAVNAAVGLCAFTNDPLRHLMIETKPSIRFESAEECMLDLDTALSLTDYFFLVVSGILDLFDPPFLNGELPSWIENASERSKPKSAIIYLALAIGAQGRARDESDEVIAEKCFAYGRQLAMFTLLDDPSLMTVQAFTLITYYMIAACRRNAAFTNLGVAVRAAYTLGVHLHEANTAFVREEGISRERAWKSLRVCDLFLSASMGRPPATSETVSNIPWASHEPTSDRESSSVSSQAFSAIFRICDIFERILLEGYSKKAVTLDLAKSISKQHRQWTEELPRMLMIDGLEGWDSTQNPGLSPQHGSGIVTMAYYYSIVLLTRPFLTYRVRHSLQKDPLSQKFDNSPAQIDLATYADACVDSAIKGIDIAHEFVFEKHTSRRQPLVVNSVFISALCLGLAYLGNYDQKRWPLGRCLDRAITILTHLGHLNPQSVRYAEICSLLKEATISYVEKRDATLLQSNSRSVRSVFGDVRASVEPRISSQENGGIGIGSRPNGPDFSPDEGATDQVSPSSLVSSILRQESMIPTSGTTPGHFSNGYRYPYNDNHGMASLPQNCVSAYDTHSLDGYSFDNEVPLFSLTNDLASNEYFW